MNDLAEVYFIAQYEQDPYRSCRIVCKAAIDFSEDVGKMLIIQFLHETQGIKIDSINNTNQKKFEFAVKKSVKYFLNDQ